MTGLHGPAPERGAGTAVTGVVMLAVCLAMVVAMWIVGWLGSLHGARRAADLAALAGAQAHVRDRDPCPAARQAAARNGAYLVSCTVRGDRSAFALTVKVQVVLRPVIAGRVRHIQSSATAGSQQLR